MSSHGQVVTFYSYKGGVGRTFALANVATLLGRWGFRVLCIDWDLEAPGLTPFFRDHADEDEHVDLRAPGLVDLLRTFQPPRRTRLAWQDYVVELGSERIPGVSLLTSGLQDDRYSHRLQRLNWSALYRRGLGDALEMMFGELRRSYDYILIDSRTGITDFAGIITAQLPDVLLFLFTANEQSFEGATDVARRAGRARNDLNVDRPGLVLVPIPARFDAKVEHSIALSWRRRYVKGLGEFYRPWAARDVDVGRLVQMTTIPYIPFWSFGERLSVVEEDVFDPQSINYSLENIAAMLAHRMGQTRLLLASRDEFVSAARRLGRRHGRGPSVFISYAMQQAALAEAVATAVRSRGVEPILEGVGSRWDLGLEDDTSRVIEGAEHMLVLLGEDLTRRQDVEIRTFLRQAVSDERSRMLVCFSAHPIDLEKVPPLVRQYSIRVTSDPDAIAEHVSSIIASETRTEDKAGRTSFSVRLINGVGGVENAHVAVLTRSGATIDALSDVSGRVDLDFETPEHLTLLIAHPQFAGRWIERTTKDIPLTVQMTGDGRTGSTILRERGMIPDLQMILDVVTDDDGSTTVRTEPPKSDEGAGPSTLRSGEPVVVVDRAGARVEVTLRRAAGMTALVDYRIVRGATSASHLASTFDDRRDRQLRRIYLSFHVSSDLWRAAVVRDALFGAGYDVFGLPDPSIVERAGQEADASLRRAISSQMQETSCIVVLVGAQTAGRRWVQYEIAAALERGNAILGLRVDMIPDLQGRRSTPGPNPFENVQVRPGTSLDEIAPLFTPKGANGAAVFSHIKGNMRRWIDQALRMRLERP